MRLTWNSISSFFSSSASRPSSPYVTPSVSVTNLTESDGQAATKKPDLLIPSDSASGSGVGQPPPSPAESLAPSTASERDFSAPNSPYLLPKPSLSALSTVSTASSIASASRQDQQEQLSRDASPHSRRKPSLSLTPILTAASIAPSDPSQEEEQQQQLERGGQAPNPRDKASLSPTPIPAVAPTAPAPAPRITPTPASLREGKHPPDVMMRHFPKPTEEVCVAEMVARAPLKRSLRYHVEHCETMYPLRQVEEDEGERKREFEEAKRELLAAEEQFDSQAAKR